MRIGRHTAPKNGKADPLYGRGNELCTLKQETGGVERPTLAEAVRGDLAERGQVSGEVIKWSK